MSLSRSCFVLITVIFVGCDLSSHLIHTHVSTLMASAFSYTFYMPNKNSIPQELKSKIPNSKLILYNSANANDGLIFEKNLQKKIVEQLFCSSKISSSLPNSDKRSRRMIELSLAGIGAIDAEASNDTKKKSIAKDTFCIFLAPPQYLLAESQPFPAIAVPISSNKQSKKSILNLLKSAYVNEPMSKSRCLLLNSIFVNRDGSLFDSIPWSTWTIGSHTKDAAGNPIDKKYHFGKRDAYQRFMGKDWPGRSLSYGNLAQKILYLLGDKEDKNTIDQDEVQILAKRILEVECQELRVAIADVEQKLAITRNGNTENVNDIKTQIVMLESSIENLMNDLDMKETALQNLEEQTSIINSLLEEVVNLSTNNDTMAAPYRGAYGFAPLIDSKSDMMENSILPYRGPYDLLNEILDDQLNANVIGLVLEDTWILDDRVMIGGSCVMQRKRDKKKVIIDGEEVEFFDDEEDEDEDEDEDINENELDELVNEESGNSKKKKTVKGGDVFIAECDADEAIGLSLSMGSYIQIEKELWENMNFMACKVERSLDDPNVSPTLAEIQILKEDEFKIEKVDNTSRQDEKLDEEKQSFVPKTTSSFFSSSADGNSEPNTNSDVPIQSLSQLDNLGNSEKAKILLSLGSFRQSNSKLPRPRTLRNNPNILTELLLPYIDESVRRQYNIREAKRNDDMETVKALEQQKSRRQEAKELADSSDDEDMKNMWEEESDFYASLRADVTQDEGSYSRFLDKDDWYERDRIKRAKNVNKSSFGTLLDGLE